MARLNAKLASCAAGIILFPIRLLAAEPFQVDGYIDVTRFDSKGAPEKVLFRAKVAGSKFRIFALPRVFYDSVETGCDGTNLVTIHRFETQLARIDRNIKAAPPAIRRYLREDAPPKHPAPSICVGLAKSKLPRSYPDPTISIVWLSFASESYFAEGRQSTIPPLYDLSISPVQDVCYTLATTAPRTPRRIEFLSDGIADIQMRVPWSPPFDQGFTNAVYLVRAVTNFHGLVLPLAFTMSETSPTFRNGNRGNRLEQIATYHGFVTNITTATESDFLPAIPTGQSVYFSDSRAAAHAGYVTNRLLSLAEVAAQQASLEKSDDPAFLYLPVLPLP